MLLAAKAEEDARMGASSDGAAAVRRWTGVRGAVEARALLKTLFRAASHYKAQARRLRPPGPAGASVCQGGRF